MLKQVEENAKVEFLGKEIKISDESEAEQHAQDTLFGGFWKTMKKFSTVNIWQLQSPSDVEH